MAANDARDVGIVILPVKGGYAAKSRLAGIGPDQRTRLARAIASDVAAVAASVVGPESVVVVTADPQVTIWAEAAGHRVASEPGGGINPAVTAAESMTRRSRSRFALLGDVAALRPEDLAAGMQACQLAGSRAFVPDHLGSGTVLLSAAPGVPLDPHFGPESAAAHRASGARQVDLDLPSLRTDVDDIGTLLAAVRLGVGGQVREVLTEVTYADGMQGTVFRIESTGAGEVILDDGTLVPFAPEVLADSGLRLVRPGQRVSLLLADQPRQVSALWIVGVPRSS